jgi:hypothetical protein
MKETALNTAKEIGDEGVLRGVNLPLLLHQPK